MPTDVLILGGGPAGLAAAYEVASRGYKATIVDEARDLGGQLRAQTQTIDPMPDLFSGLRGFELAHKLIERLQTFPVEYLLPYEAIGVYSDGSVGVSSVDKLEKVISKSIVVATGAAESALPFPGWTLPGIITIGAAQLLINRERVFPGKTTVVVGSSDMALGIVSQMHGVGIEVLAVIEAGSQVSARNKERIIEFQETRIPLLLQTNIVSASGRRKVEEVYVCGAAAGSRERKYQVDFVCLDGGRHPILEALAMLDCQFSYCQALGGWLPSYTTDLKSSTPGVFVAGQAAGITGHAGILLTGAIAGISAVEYLEKQAIPERQSRKQVYWNELQRLETLSFPDVWNARSEHMVSSMHKHEKSEACSG